MLPPGLDIFLLPGAHDPHTEQLGRNVWRLTFSYNGSVQAQSAQLHATLDRAGWSIPPNGPNCGGQCQLGKTLFVYRRYTLFNRISDLAMIEQRGTGPYHVSVLVWRCYKVPWEGCWPGSNP